MKFCSLLRVELLRLLRSRATWFALAITALCPLAGYSLYQPAGTGTTAALVMANPLLAGALGGAFIFAALTLFELDRVRKDRMEPITDSITSPMRLSVIKTVSLLLTALLSCLLTCILYLPYTWLRLAETFQIGEYCKFSAIFLLSTLGMGVLLASAFYQIFRRVDLGFVCFAAIMLAGLGPWNRDTYLLYWIDLSTLGFSGNFGNTSIYRMALYSRTIWLCLFGGIWLLSLLCSRTHGKKLPGSLIRNLRKVYLPVLAAAFLTGGAALFLSQPYMDHEAPTTVVTSGSTGGGMTVSMGQSEEENPYLTLRHTEMDLKFDTWRGILYGEVCYQMENSSGQPQDCLLETSPGCTIERITVNGNDIPFTDLQNDHFILLKNISLTLPEDQTLEVVINYQYSPQIPANTGILMLYDEITPEYVSVGGKYAVPGFQAVATADGTFAGQVTLPASMELIAGGKTPRIAEEHPDGTTTWDIQGNGAQANLFAGNYIRVKIPDTQFPVYFCYSKTHQKEFEQLDIETLLRDTISYCTEQYGPLPYTEEYPLNIVMASAHLQGGGTKDNLSFMGETFFTAHNLNDPLKGAGPQRSSPMRSSINGGAISGFCWTWRMRTGVRRH